MSGLWEGALRIVFQMGTECFINVIFWDTQKKECWKLNFDMAKIRLDEILICIKYQFRV